MTPQRAGTNPSTCTAGEVVATGNIQKWQELGGIGNPDGRDEEGSRNKPLRPPGPRLPNSERSGDHLLPLPSSSPPFPSSLQTGVFFCKEVDSGKLLNRGTKRAKDEMPNSIRAISAPAHTNSPANFSQSSRLEMCLVYKHNIRLVTTRKSLKSLV